MRVVGIILVAVGVLGLGWHGFAGTLGERNDEIGVAVREGYRTIWVPPVVSGIAIVSGLILLASNGRREEL